MMLQSVLLPFSYLQALSHVAVMIKDHQRIVYVLSLPRGFVGRLKQFLMSYVPDPFLSRNDVIAKWRQEGFWLCQTSGYGCDCSHREGVSIRHAMTLRSTVISYETDHDVYIYIYTY